MMGNISVLWEHCCSVSAWYRVTLKRCSTWYVAFAVGLIHAPVYSPFSSPSLGEGSCCPADPHSFGVVGEAKGEMGQGQAGLWDQRVSEEIVLGWRNSWEWVGEDIPVLLQHTIMVQKPFICRSVSAAESEGLRGGRGDKGGSEGGEGNLHSGGCKTPVSPFPK